MTVFYILDSFPVLSETFILREIIALKRLGINIRICALKKASGESAATDCQLSADVIYADKLPLKAKICALAGNICRRPAYCGLLMLSLFRDMFFSFRFMCQRLRGAVNAMAIADLAGTRPDHVHAHFAYVAADTARILSGLAGCRWSVSAHAWEIFTQPPETVARRVEKADRIFACSKHGADLMGKILSGKDRIILMYHGVDTGEFDIGMKAEHIVAVGRLEDKKGFDILLKACKLLDSRNIRPRCVIAGEGPRRSFLESEIRKLGLGNVELAGAMSFDRIKKLMAESIMLVHPGRIAGGGDHDGIPNVILEAMALGKPVVATSVGGIPELIEDGVNGLLTRDEDPERLAESIKRLLEDAALSERLGKAAKEHIRKNFETSENVQPLFKYLKSQEKADKGSNGIQDNR